LICRAENAHRRNGEFQMSNDEKTIFVYADWLETEPVLVGKSYVSISHANEVFSFEYSDEWLQKHDEYVALDPDLSLYAGRQYTPIDKQVFGFLSDSSPDRWGRLLMKRKESIAARKESRKPRALTESDFLLGVFDKSRIGALRLSLAEGGPFLADKIELSAPPWATLRSLETASLAFETGGDQDEEKWLIQLLAPGSSLGGARPKASVQAPDGSLWIAKFPSKNDEWNSGAWEMVVHDLAVKCMLNVPEAKLENFSDNGSTYLVKRFDRLGEKRIHYASAMALLGKTDGRGSDDSSYLDVASFIKSNGAHPDNDLIELWKRVVFTIAVSNTDDHLRNHGFILTDHGWTLSPMFDVNPNIYGNTLSLNISHNDNTMDIGLALETAQFYGIGLKEAKEIEKGILKTVRDNWRDIASEYGINRNLIKDMEAAFIHSS